MQPVIFAEMIPFPWHFYPKMDQQIFKSQPEHFKSPVRNARLDSLCLKNSFILCRNFHLSEPRRAAPLLPVIGAFLARFSGPIAQLLKLMAVVVGR
jgi:hypothetical protein